MLPALFDNINKLTKSIMYPVYSNTLTHAHIHTHAHTPIHTHTQNHTQLECEKFGQIRRHSVHLGLG